MTIDELGFLSPDINFWLKKHRSENPEWFKLADDASRAGNRQLSQLNIASDNNVALIAASLFMRGLSNFQGMILMTERGMTLEGRILTRSCYETAFFLGALRKDSSFADAIVSDDASRRKKMAHRLLNIPEENSGLEPHHHQKLNDFLTELEQADYPIKDLAISAAAKTAGMLPEYNTIYLALLEFEWVDGMSGFLSRGGIHHAGSPIQCGAWC